MDSEENEDEVVNTSTMFDTSSKSNECIIKADSNDDQTEKVTFFINLAHAKAKTLFAPPILSYNHYGSHFNLC